MELEAEYRFINRKGKEASVRQSMNMYLKFEGKNVFVDSFVLSTQFPLNNVPIWGDNGAQKLSESRRVMEDRHGQTDTAS